MGRLADKVVVVVGAGQMAGEGTGNGRATALRMAAEGATLVLVNRGEPSLLETVEIIAREFDKPDPVVADVSSEEDCARIVGDTIARYGRIDVLHNNVGVGPYKQDASLTDAGKLNRLMSVNLIGPMMLTKYALGPMVKARRGVITHVGSTCVATASEFRQYRLTKAALHEFAQSVALDFGRYNIRCNVLMPGLIDTPMAQSAYKELSGSSLDDIRRDLRTRVPMDRLGLAEEVAAAAVFLASDEASYINGVLLPVDGGLLANIGSSSQYAEPAGYAPMIKS